MFLLMNDKNVKVVKNVEARAEGKRILEAFRINTDNPIAILQQEEAKELLRVESPRNLYDFFQKATLLMQCKEQYTDAEVAMEKTKHTLEAKNKQIKALGREVNEKHDQLLKLDRMIERDAEEVQLENEYVWANYHQNVEEREKINQKMGQKENAMEIPMTELAELNKKKHKIEMDLSRQTEKLNEERKRNQREEGELTKLRHKIDGFKENEKELRKNLKGMEQSRNTATSEVRILTDQLSEMDKLKANREKMAKEREEKLEKLEKRRKSIADAIET